MQRLGDLYADGDEAAGEVLRVQLEELDRWLCIVMKDGKKKVSIEESQAETNRLLRSLNRNVFRLVNATLQAQGREELPEEELEVPDELHAGEVVPDEDMEDLPEDSSPRKRRRMK
jgi:hypothetical protein